MFKMAQVSWTTIKSYETPTGKDVKSYILEFENLTICDDNKKKFFRPLQSGASTATYAALFLPSDWGGSCKHSERIHFGCLCSRSLVFASCRKSDRTIGKWGLMSVWCCKIKWNKNLCCILCFGFIKPPAHQHNCAISVWFSSSVQHFLGLGLHCCFFPSSLLSISSKEKKNLLRANGAVLGLLHFCADKESQNEFYFHFFISFADFLFEWRHELLCISLLLYSLIERKVSCRCPALCINCAHF